MPVKLQVSEGLLNNLCKYFLQINCKSSHVESMLEKRVLICWLQFAKVLNRVTGDCSQSLQPKTDLCPMSPQERICVDKCHQKNDLTFWPVNFHFHYEKNNMRVSCSGWSTSVHWFRVSLCQVGDLLKRTTTLHRFHTKSQRPHHNIWSQHTPKFMYIVSESNVF